MNGVPADLDQIKALALINYGHFTSMRVDEQRVRGLSLHLERLMRDCRRVFDADLDPERIRHRIRHALVDTPRSIVVRVTVFDPTLELVLQGQMYGRASLTCDDASPVFPATRHFSSI